MSYITDAVAPLYAQRQLALEDYRAARAAYIQFRGSRLPEKSLRLYRLDAYTYRARWMALHGVVGAVERRMAA